MICFWKFATYHLADYSFLYLDSNYKEARSSMNSGPWQVSFLLVFLQQVVAVGKQKLCQVVLSSMIILGRPPALKTL